MPTTSTEITTTEPQALGELWQLIISTDQQMACVPQDVRFAVQATFKTLWAHIQQQDEANALMVDRINHARALIEAQRAGMESLEQQREAIAEEYANLLNALEQSSLNPLSAPPELREMLYKLYSQVKETHNEAFWQSLPYDIASMMSQGGILDVDHEQAQTLYDLLTTDFENEANPEDYGWTHEQVMSARLRLIEIANRMINLSYEDGEGNDDDIAE